MKYCIMCGGSYRYWKYPKQLSMIHGETLIERTVRLLKENGVALEDMFITASYELIEILRANEKRFADLPMTYCLTSNDYEVAEVNRVTNGLWLDCFGMRHKLGTTFLMGDVVYSPEAIKKIVETETKDIDFFASAPPFARNYSKPWAEPFAFKVVDIEGFERAVRKTEKYAEEGAFRRSPIAWELWQVIKGTELNHIDYTNYITINDYTCDIDLPEDIKKFEGGEEWHIS